MVTASYGCGDATSGVDSCVGTVANGGSLDTSSVGQHTFTVTARDHAGNERTKTVTYTVVFAFAGFFEPVANPPTVNVTRAGKGVPLPFGLGGDYGLAIFAAGYPQAQTIACDPKAKTKNVAGKDVSSSSLSYDKKANRYTYTWKTDQSWANSCRQLNLKLTDGTVHTVLFKLTR